MFMKDLPRGELQEADDIIQSKDTVANRMERLVRLEHLRDDLSAKHFAGVLRCTPTAIKKTPGWKQYVANRKRKKAAANAGYYLKHERRKGGVAETPEED